MLLPTDHHLHQLILARRIAGYRFELQQQRLAGFYLLHILPGYRHLAQQLAGKGNLLIFKLFYLAGETIAIGEPEYIGQHRQRSQQPPQQKKTQHHTRSIKRGALKKPEAIVTGYPAHAQPDKDWT